MKKGTTLLRTLLLGLLGTMLGTMDVWAAEAYVYVADNDQTTLHFYNDNQRSARNSTGITYDLNGGQVRPTWTSASDYQETITTVESCALVTSSITSKLNIRLIRLVMRRRCVPWALPTMISPTWSASGWKASNT